MNCTVAVIQMDPVLGDVPANIRTHIRAAEQAALKGANVVVFPELSLTGYTVKDLAADLAFDPYSDPLLRPLQRLSKKVTIVAGGIIQGDDHGIYNAGICFDGGETVHVHRKIYTPTYGLFEEGRYFSSGRSVEAFQTRHGRFGILVCEDMWHPSLPYLAVLDGAEVIFSLTASPTRVGPSDGDLDNKTINHEHQRSFARLFSSYMIFANRVGFEDGVNFWGGSAVFAPDGERLAEARLFEKDVITARLNSTSVRRARRVSRHVLDERPDIVMENLRRILDKTR